MTTKSATKTKPSAATAEGKEFIISRVIDAPLERVWKAWTDAKQLKNWWGPKGFEIVSTKVNLRPGGIFHYHLRSADGQDMWGKFTYHEIVPQKRLVFVVSFSDEAGGVTRHPLHEKWPLTILSSVTFAQANGRTTVTVRWIPVDATKVERETFEDGRESMKAGGPELSTGSTTIWRRLEPLARAWRARVTRMHRRRWQGRQADLVPAQCEAQAEHLQIARPSRPRQRQGHEGQADRRHGPQVNAVRCKAHDLRRLQGHRRGLSLSAGRTTSPWVVSKPIRLGAGLGKKWDDWR
jgi:uncharacterized protein YndB with AHSA1/START domain